MPNPPRYWIRYFLHWEHILPLFAHLENHHLGYCLCARIEMNCHLLMIDIAYHRQNGFRIHSGQVIQPGTMAVQYAPMTQILRQKELSFSATSFPFNFGTAEKRMIT